MRVRYEILGPLRVWHGNRELKVHRPELRALLATLLLDPNRPVPVARIHATVWRGVSSGHPIGAIQRLVEELDRLIDPGVTGMDGGRLIGLSNGTFLLAVEPGSLEATEFVARTEQARRLRADGRWHEAMTVLEQALAMWPRRLGAEPLAGLAGPAFDAARAGIVATRGAAVEELAEVLLELRPSAVVLPFLAGARAEYPLSERLCVTQMLALYRDGRQPEALAAFEHFRGLLAAAGGAQASGETRLLHFRMVRRRL
ncbi:BTAD domain-containing putative transcriptional regulator [Streptomyces sp. SID13031]|uniref:AfsR/SARP family transcriptional regulator n=1 Tax=Streptomyces sp. SID13031 TaxID=2706046 RepID=UPI0013C8392B|nr:BTAD domain-containing putative transcriptional regulator [Streptomyces sp. SID13031]NEA30942.1 hypothetical protein [Streptomyces sp. SID13031]